MKEISITDIEGIRIGHAADDRALTGCTAIIADEGAMAGVCIRGGGPATRETPLLDPVKNCQAIHCVMFSGGSAYGLAAGDGAMKYLEEKGIGYKIRDLIVPLVVGASIFDLTIGDPTVRPDKEMGYRACLDSEKGSPAQGRVGAGIGATVGKLKGLEYMTRAGLGIYAAEKEDIKCGAVAVVNALGDVRDRGEIVAGIRDEDGCADSEQIMIDLVTADATLPRENTTLVCLITNVLLTKDEATKVAEVSHNGLARAIYPVHTNADGDSVFCLSTGKVQANTDALGAMASEVTRRAIINAVTIEEQGAR